MYRKRPQSWVKHTDFIFWDVVCLQLAFVLACWFRNGWCNPYASELYRGLALAYVFVDLFVLIYNSTLKNVLKRGVYKELAATIKHVFWVEILMTFLFFVVQRGGDFSRTIILLIGIFYALLSFMVRSLWKSVLTARAVSGGREGLFVITTGDRLDDLTRTILERYRSIYYMAGFCITDADRKGEEVAGIPVCCNYSELIEYLCRAWTDEVFVALPPNDPATDELIDKLTEMGLVVHLELMNPYELHDSKQFVQQMGKHTVLTISINQASTAQLILKRLVDIAAGLAGCVVTLFLTVILAPLIYIASPGPVFFSQTRVGRNGKPFKMYKFRSMVPDAEASKLQYASQNSVPSGLMFKLDFDPRIIGARILPDGSVKKGIGNLIRDFSLDEFPQFFNVLKGDMSLVGTRPPTLDEWNKYQLHHRSRLAFKPGITGLWQVSGRSDITDFEQVVSLDRSYILHWSFALDASIIFKTFRAVLHKQGAR